MTTLKKPASIDLSAIEELRGDKLADIVASEKVTNLLATIYAGHDVRWDGSNHRGYLDGEAESALDELADYLDRIEPSEETAQAIMDEENEEASC